MSYECPTAKVYGLSEKKIQSIKPVSGVDGAPMTVLLATVPMTFRADISRAY